MSWFNEKDFLHDLDYLSFDSNDVKPRRYANINRSLQSSVINSYWESDDEEDVVGPSRGRGRLPAGPTSHLQVMNEIQRDVRSTVGNRYQNESIELYYNILQNEGTFDDAPEDIDKPAIEVSAENTANPTESLGNCNGIVRESNVLNGDVRSLSSILSNGKQYSGRGCKISRNFPETYPAHIDIKSNNEFPTL